MIFIEAELKGAYLVKPEKYCDERGFFAKSWCQSEFIKKGLTGNFVQTNVSFNSQKGTVRGLHSSESPYEEIKLIRCTRGSIYDVIIDIRPYSPTYCKWITVELSERNHYLLYIPKGFLHGYQALEENTEVYSMISEFYYKDFQKGARWNDPTFNVKWPLEVTCISKKDSFWSDFMKESD